MKYLRLKAKYEGRVLKPDKALDLPEGTEVTLLVIPPFRSFLGILEGVEKDSVTLQHLTKDLWSTDVG